MAKAAIGFGRERRTGEDTAAIERTFTPEFRNRLDAVISFAPLGKEIILQVVEKFVLQLEAQLMDRNVHIELTPEAAAWLGDKGYDDKMGARPLGRVIQEHIKKPLAEELLFGKLTKGGVVKVSEASGSAAGHRLDRRTPAQAEMGEDAARVIVVNDLHGAPWVALEAPHRARTRVSEHPERPVLPHEPDRRIARAVVRDGGEICHERHREQGLRIERKAHLSAR
jgi:hypothetical protein